MTATWHPPVELRLPGLLLRPWQVADVPAMGRILEENDAHLRPWTPFLIDGRVPGQTLEERLVIHAEEFTDGARWVYGVFDAADGGILGGCGLYPRVGPGAIEIGYWLAAAATGRGIATRVAEALIEIAFQHPEIVRVEIRCDPRNIASARIPERLGFTIEPSPVVPADGLQVWTLDRDRTDDTSAGHSA